MHHNSSYNGEKISDIRYKLGFAHGKNETNILENSIVIPVVNTSIPYGNGFADAINVKCKQYLIKKVNSGRTFILPTKNLRRVACDNKFDIINSHKLKNKNLYIVDDSIVRGTTLSSLVNKLKLLSPKSIHVRIMSPQVISPCYFGIDMSTTKELLAYNKTDDQIKEILNIDSIKYMNMNTMKLILGNNICTSCFTGKYNEELFSW